MKHIGRLSGRSGVLALLVLSGSVGLAAHGNAAASGRSGATSGGYTLAPAMMGGGAGKPHADPNASLVYNIGTDVSTADPQVMEFTQEIQIASQVYAPLLTLTPDNKVAQNAAESMTVSPDGKTYTFKLRRTTYSDGKPVTASDYAYGIKRGCDPVVNGNYSNILYDIVGCEDWRMADTSKVSKAKLNSLAHVVDDSVKALDARTLRIKLLHPTGYFPYIMTTWVTDPVRPDLVKKGGANWWMNPTYYVGNGPFKVVKYTPRQEWVFARNDSYFRGKPGIKTLTFKIIGSPQTSFLAYQQNELDLDDLTADQYPQVEASSTLRSQLIRRVHPETYFMDFYTASPPFNNTKVRQAFSYAMNRDLYLRQITDGIGKATGQFVPPDLPGYETQFQQTYNPGKARQLLAQAGYPNGRGFPTLNLYYPNDDESSKKQSVFWAQQYRQVLNVNVQATPMDPVELQKKRAAGTSDLKLHLARWGADYPHPQDFLTLVFADGGEGKWNDPTYNALVHKADRLPLSEALPLYKKAGAYLAQQAPSAFFENGEDLGLIKPDVKGYLSFPGDPYGFIGASEKIYKTK